MWNKATLNSKTRQIWVEENYDNDDHQKEEINVEPRPTRKEKKERIRNLYKDDEHDK